MDHTNSSTSSSQSSLLLALPEDIIEHIISLASDPLQPSKLRGVLRTCKKLHEIALPIWVQSYKLDENSKVFDFLSYIMNDQRGLAPYVKKIEVGWTSDTVQWAAMQDLRKTVHVLTNLLPSAYQLGTSDYVIAGFTFPRTAHHLLLAACSQVETLVLPRTTLLVPDSVQSAGHNVPETAVRVLGALRHVTLTTAESRLFHESMAGRSFNKYVWLRNAVHLLQLPNIQDFDISEAVGLFSEDVSLQHATFPEGQSNVKNIRFHRSVLGSHVLHKVIRCPKSLKTFEYSVDWFLHGIPDESLRQVRAGDVMKAVKVHACTLEKLRLEFGDDYGKPDHKDLPPDCIYLGLNLRKMTALKTLSVSMQALTGFLDLLPVDHPNPIAYPSTREGAPRLVQCLPPNLEELTITNCGSAILEQVQEFLDAVASGSFPHLRLVALAFNIERTPPGSIQLTCAAPDVAIQLRYESIWERSSRIGLNVEQVNKLIARREAASLPIASPA